LVILTFYFIAGRFLRDTKMIELINTCVVSATCDFIQHARTTSCAQNRYHRFAIRYRVTLFAVFTRFFCKFAIVWQALKSLTYIYRLEFIQHTQNHIFCDLQCNCNMHIQLIQTSQCTSLRLTLTCNSQSQQRTLYMYDIISITSLQLSTK